MFSEKHVEAFKRWKAFGGLSRGMGEACKHLSEPELDALLEDRNFEGEVIKERQRRAEAMTPPPALPPAAPTPVARYATLADLEFREGEALEEYDARNAGRAAPVAYVAGSIEGLQTRLRNWLHRDLGSIATKNSHRNRRLDDLERTLGVLSALPHSVERGQWRGSVLYYPDDAVRHDGREWRCLSEHRADSAAPPGSDESRNVWESVEPPIALPGDGSSVLERLATVEAALGLTPPEPRR